MNGAFVPSIRSSWVQMCNCLVPVPGETKEYLLDMKQCVGWRLSMLRYGPSTKLSGWMADTVFQCIQLLTVLEYLVLGMNKYINHLRLRRAEPSDGYTLWFAAYEDHWQGGSRPFSHSVFGHLSASYRDNDYQGSNIQNHTHDALTIINSATFTSTNIWLNKSCFYEHIDAVTFFRPCLQLTT